MDHALTPSIFLYKKWMEDTLLQACCQVFRKLVISALFLFWLVNAAYSRNYANSYAVMFMVSATEHSLTKHQLCVRTYVGWIDFLAVNIYGSVFQIFCLSGECIVHFKDIVHPKLIPNSALMSHLRFYVISRVIICHVVIRHSIVHIPKPDMLNRFIISELFNNLNVRLFLASIWYK